MKLSGSKTVKAAADAFNRVGDEFIRLGEQNGNDIDWWARLDKLELMKLLRRAMNDHLEEPELETNLNRAMAYLIALRNQSLPNRGTP